MFGKKKSAGKTVLLLDIESGSVGSALLHLSNAAPKLYAYQRTLLPLHSTNASEVLTRSLEGALAQTLRHVGDVSARMRVHAPQTQAGDVSQVVVFFAAPWGTPDLVLGKSSFLPGLREYVANELKAAVGVVPTSFYTSADSIAYGTNKLGSSDGTLLLSLRGELIELMHMGDAGAQSFGTVPGGVRSILRTLRTHGNLTEHEAHSTLKLMDHHHLRGYEPVVAAARHLTSQFADGAQLLLEANPSKRILVVGEGVLGDWLAKSIIDEPKLEGLFSEDSVVESLNAHQVHQKLGAQTSVHDPYVLLEALFVDGISKVKQVYTN